MAKEYPASPKAQQLQESKKQRLTYILVVSALCVAFYVLGAWQNTTVPKPAASSAITKVGCDPAAAGQSSAVPSFGSASQESLDFEAHHQLSLDDTDAEAAVQPFPACPLNFSEYTPCEDRKRGRRFERAMLVYRERHCPGKDEEIRCLIPAPPKYRTPFKWPQSRDFAWFNNIPHKELSIEKAVQNWIQVDGQRFRFPGGGTMFPRGADTYIDDIGKLISLTDGKIRTAIDTGCGVRGEDQKKHLASGFLMSWQCAHAFASSLQVASWGAYLLKRNILAMSFAPRDTHEAQVQFALERGVPAIIGVMGKQRLPYPSRSFDMAHCSRCLIPWHEFGEHFNTFELVSMYLAPSFQAILRSKYCSLIELDVLNFLLDGIYLAEVDRILRPGGYWILSGPPINWKTHYKGWERTKEDLKEEQDNIEDVARSLCWNKVVEKGDLSIWQKPKNHLECANIKKKYKTPHICKSDNPDAAWYGIAAPTRLSDNSFRCLPLN